jgi:hypothetical protein
MLFIQVLITALYLTKPLIVTFHHDVNSNCSRYGSKLICRKNETSLNTSLILSLIN